MYAKNSNKFEISEKKLEVMKKRLIDVEKENLKTRSKTETEMIDYIRNIIIEEAKKNY